ncbi:hypothetical protein Bhyg_15558 [Pseudolycoriella hygida]|uniref:Uncharacterized protein n=1 Tax=Pseudolycoriella hygida TaxID=35572 RepID=A0A9Q0RVR3_9DIPT|nr:hypothetical protein Bhyg_15558 [Pseudolycoriella hygida]
MQFTANYFNYITCEQSLVSLAMQRIEEILSRSRLACLSDVVIPNINLSVMTSGSIMLGTQGQFRTTAAVRCPTKIRIIDTQPKRSLAYMAKR